MSNEIVISAGHSLSDPGATVEMPDGSILKEADLNIKVRDILSHILRSSGMRVIAPCDTYSLRHTIKYLKEFSGTPVLEIHFNAFNSKVSGVEAFTSKEKLINRIALSLVKRISSCFEIPNRGIKKADKSKRGSLGLLKELQESMILEVCFMDNPADLTKVVPNGDPTGLCRIIAEVLFGELAAPIGDND